MEHLALYYKHAESLEHLPVIMHTFFHYAMSSPYMITHLCLEQIHLLGLN